jgi:hypothetical protein
MAKSTKNATAAFWRLVHDDEVQQHLRTAAAQGHEAWQRVARLPGSKAVEDKKLYDKVREAATSLARAVKLLAPEPEPPKRHRARTLVGVALTAGAVAIVLKTQRARPSPTHEEPQTTATPPAPVPSPEDAPVGTASA